MNDRIEALRRRAAEGGAEAVLVSLPYNRRYLSGLTATDSPGGGSAGWLLVTRDEALLLVGFLALEQARQECPGVEARQFVGSPAPLLAEVVREQGIKRLACEGHHLTYATFQEIVRHLPEGTELLPVEGWVEDLRAVKDDAELAKIRRAAQITDLALAHVLAIVKPGMSERELGWEAERHMRESGADGLAFEVSVASGPNTALPHARGSDRRIQAHEPIWIDMGAQYDGYCADLTRTFCLGEPEERLRELWNLVLAAQQAAVAHTRVGLTGAAADALAREVIAAAGCAEAFGHGLGHGVGLVVHEKPRLGPTSGDVLRAGNVVTFEPGIYLPGWGGVRIEDLGVLRPEGVEVLSQAVKNLIVA